VDPENWLSRTLRDGHGYNEVLTYVLIQLDVPNGVPACLRLCSFPTRPASQSRMAGATVSGSPGSLRRSAPAVPAPGAGTSPRVHSRYTRTLAGRWPSAPGRRTMAAGPSKGGRRAGLALPSATGRGRLDPTERGHADGGLPPGPDPRSRR
jgi:hypothetical protein